MNSPNKPPPPRSRFAPMVPLSNTPNNERIHPLLKGFATFLTENERILNDEKRRTGNILTYPRIVEIIEQFGETIQTIEHFEIPKKYTQIWDSAFRGFGSLTSIIIPETIEKIGVMTFQCSKLKSIAIPASVAEIGGLSFDNCDELESINVALDNLNYADVDGVLFNKDKTELLRYPRDKKDTIYQVPDSVIHIKERAFENCQSIEKITIPNSVISIGKEAFSGCSKLESAFLSESITIIEDRLFFNCWKLRRISIPAGVTTIWSSAFEGCFSLTSVMLPDSLKTIGNFAFSACRKLDTLVIPDGVVELGYFMFSDCELSELTLPNSVTKIGESLLRWRNKTVVNCSRNSYAHKYCKKEKYTVRLTGASQNKSKIINYKNRSVTAQMEKHDNAITNVLTTLISIMIIVLLLFGMEWLIPDSLQWYNWFSLTVIPQFVVSAGILLFWFFFDYVFNKTDASELTNKILAILSLLFAIVLCGGGIAVTIHAGLVPLQSEYTLQWYNWMLFIGISVFAGFWCLYFVLSESVFLPKRAMFSLIIGLAILAQLHFVGLMWVCLTVLPIIALICGIFLAVLGHETVTGVDADIADTAFEKTVVSVMSIIILVCVIGFVFGGIIPLLSV